MYFYYASVFLLKLSYLFPFGFVWWRVEITNKRVWEKILFFSSAPPLGSSTSSRELLLKRCWLPPFTPPPPPPSPHLLVYRKFKLPQKGFYNTEICFLRKITQLSQVEWLRSQDFIAKIHRTKCRDYASDTCLVSFSLAYSDWHLIVDRYWKSSQVPLVSINP